MFAVLVQHYCLNNNAGLTKEILQKFDKKSQNTVFISVEKLKKKKKKLKACKPQFLKFASSDTIYSQLDGFYKLMNFLFC